MAIFRLRDDYFTGVVNSGIIFRSIAMMIYELRPNRQFPAEIRWTRTFENEWGQVIELYHLPVVDDPLHAAPQPRCAEVNWPRTAEKCN